MSVNAEFFVLEAMARSSDTAEKGDSLSLKEIAFGNLLRAVSETLKEEGVSDTTKVENFLGNYIASASEEKMSADQEGALEELGGLLKELKNDDAEALKVNKKITADTAQVGQLKDEMEKLTAELKRLKTAEECLIAALFNPFTVIGAAIAMASIGARMAVVTHEISEDAAKSQGLGADITKLTNRLGELNRDETAALQLLGMNFRDKASGAITKGEAELNQTEKMLRMEAGYLGTLNFVQDGIGGAV